MGLMKKRGGGGWGNRRFMGAGHLGVPQLRDRLASRDAPQHEVTDDVTLNSRQAASSWTMDVLDVRYTARQYDISGDEAEA